MKASRTSILFVVFVVACVAIFAASMGAARLAHEGDSNQTVVRVDETGFEPRSVEIGAGDKVVFENAGQEAHWPASDNHPTHTEYSAFDPKKALQPGERWSFEFGRPGRWKYHDHSSPYLTGEIVARSESAERSPGGLAASVWETIAGVYSATISVFSPDAEGGSAASGESEEKAQRDELFQEGGERPEGVPDEVKAGYLDQVRDGDVSVALAQVREKAETDDAFARSCHDLAHAIGHEAYKEYGDFGEAMKYQDEVCNSGYLHGIIEERFSQSDDVFADMKTMCDRYRQTSYLGWQCYHGIGHGTMYYTSNDLPRSLEMCDAFRGTLGRSSCANGVFMENFASDQKLHLSEYLKESDPFYPCAEQKPRHKGDCYLYAPTYYLSLHENRYDDALDWCEGAEGSFEDVCAQGVGNQATKENINDPKMVEEVCMRGAPKYRESCIKGIAGLYINHYGSLQPARELCDRLEAANQDTCRSSVDSRSSMFDA